MSVEPPFTDTKFTDSEPPKPRPTFRSRALATTAVLVTVSAVVFLVIDVRVGAHVITLPMAWALSEFHTALHMGLLGSFSDEHPVISKTTYFIGSIAMLTSSITHAHHHWAHHVRSAYVKEGLKGILPHLPKDFGSHIALCLTKAGKIAKKALHLYYDGSRRRMSQNILGVP